MRSRSRIHFRFRLNFPKRSIEETDSNNLPIQSLEMDSVALVKVLVEFRVVVLIPAWFGESRGCSVTFSDGTWLRDACFPLLLEADTCLFLSLNSTRGLACFRRFARLVGVGLRPCF